eukprot:TRINITY_DN4347_c0_g1_i3.p1 TRINITY_DN4347_c0_g1~~TRINITY_DN4347_c0_g1_i3.p1  ORF type:complete len:2313 (+),score=265.60 TRINITY_DN4347_c0_g1_i3:94-7032(+)
MRGGMVRQLLAMLSGAALAAAWVGDWADMYYDGLHLLDGMQQQHDWANLTPPEMRVWYTHDMWCSNYSARWPDVFYDGYGPVAGTWFPWTKPEYFNCSDGLHSAKPELNQQVYAGETIRRIPAHQLFMFQVNMGVTPDRRGLPFGGLYNLPRRDCMDCEYPGMVHISNRPRCEHRRQYRGMTTYQFACLDHPELCNPENWHPLDPRHVAGGEEVTDWPTCMSRLRRRWVDNPEHPARIFRDWCDCTNLFQLQTVKREIPMYKPENASGQEFWMGVDRDQENGAAPGEGRPSIPIVGDAQVWAAQYPVLLTVRRFVYRWKDDALGEEVWGSEMHDLLVEQDNFDPPQEMWWIETQDTRERTTTLRSGQRFILHIETDWYVNLRGFAYYDLGWSSYQNCKYTQYLIHPWSYTADHYNVHYVRDELTLPDGIWTLCIRGRYNCTTFMRYGESARCNWQDDFEHGDHRIVLPFNGFHRLESRSVAVGSDYQISVQWPVQGYSRPSWSAPFTIRIYTTSSSLTNFTHWAYCRHATQSVKGMCDNGPGYHRFNGGHNDLFDYPTRYLREGNKYYDAKCFGVNATLRETLADGFLIDLDLTGIPNVWGHHPLQMSGNRDEANIGQLCYTGVDARYGQLHPAKLTGGHTEMTMRYCPDGQYAKATGQWSTSWRAIDKRGYPCNIPYYQPERTITYDYFLEELADMDVYGMWNAGRMDLIDQLYGKSHVPGGPRVYEMRGCPTDPGATMPFWAYFSWNVTGICDPACPWAIRRQAICPPHNQTNTDDIPCMNDFTCESCLAYCSGHGTCATVGSVDAQNTRYSGTKECVCWPRYWGDRCQITDSPTQVPSTSPTVSPTRNPSVSPSQNPTVQPTSSPTWSPTTAPTVSPTRSPSGSPTVSPTVSPTANPSVPPTASPTTSPSASPSVSPTKVPSPTPSVSPSEQPTRLPSSSPTSLPSGVPTASPTTAPSRSPTSAPTMHPSTVPSWVPSSSPSLAPTLAPSRNPSGSPSVSPSVQPSKQPTLLPTGAPTTSPTSSPTTSPSVSPSASPSISPSTAPTRVPSVSPTTAPTGSPTRQPTDSPTASPTSAPTTAIPTVPPTVSPTRVPSASPTRSPTPHACNDGSHGCHDLSDGGVCYQDLTGWRCDCAPGYWCSAGCSGAHVGHTCTIVTGGPSHNPSWQPTYSPTSQPTISPTAVPTVSPSTAPTAAPSTAPTVSPTGAPTREPTSSPSVSPTLVPTTSPTTQPTTAPSAGPSLGPSSSPTHRPTAVPTVNPTQGPSTSPTMQPTTAPSTAPTHNPSVSPTFSIICSEERPEKPCRCLGDGVPEPGHAENRCWVAAPHGDHVGVCRASGTCVVTFQCGKGHYKAGCTCHGAPDDAYCGDELFCHHTGACVSRCPSNTHWLQCSCKDAPVGARCAAQSECTSAGLCLRSADASGPSEDLAHLFDEVDSDGSGLLTVGELEAALRKLRRGGNATADALALVKMYGHYKGGGISRRGFGYQPVWRINLFDAFDEDGSGSLSFREFTDGLIRLGGEARVHSHVDADGDGSVSRSEWLGAADEWWVEIFPRFGGDFKTGMTQDSLRRGLERLRLSAASNGTIQDFLEATDLDCSGRIELIEWLHGGGMWLHLFTEFGAPNYTAPLFFGDLTLAVRVIRTKVNRSEAAQLHQGCDADRSGVVTLAEAGCLMRLVFQELLANTEILNPGVPPLPDGGADWRRSMRLEEDARPGLRDGELQQVDGWALRVPPHQLEREAHIRYALLSKLDADRNRKVTIDEWLDNDKAGAVTAIVFGRFDTDSDGNVTVDELGSGLEEGVRITSLTSVEVERISAVADPSVTSNVNLVSFARYCSGLPLWPTIMFPRHGAPNTASPKRVEAYVLGIEVLAAEGLAARDAYSSDPYVTVTAPPPPDASDDVPIVFRGPVQRNTLNPIWLRPARWEARLRPGDAVELQCFDWDQSGSELIGRAEVYPVNELGREKGTRSRARTLTVQLPPGAMRVMDLPLGPSEAGSEVDHSEYGELLEGGRVEPLGIIRVRFTVLAVVYTHHPGVGRLRLHLQQCPRRVAAGGACDAALAAAAAATYGAGHAVELIADNGGITLLHLPEAAAVTAEATGAAVAVLGGGHWGTRIDPGGQRRALLWMYAAEVALPTVRAEVSASMPSGTPVVAAVTDTIAAAPSAEVSIAAPPAAAGAALAAQAAPRRGRAAGSADAASMSEAEEAWCRWAPCRWVYNRELLTAVAAGVAVALVLTVGGSSGWRRRARDAARGGAAPAPAPRELPLPGSPLVRRAQRPPPPLFESPRGSPRSPRSQYSPGSPPSSPRGLLG